MLKTVDKVAAEQVKLVFGCGCLVVWLFGCLDLVFWFWVLVLVVILVMIVSFGCFVIVPISLSFLFSKYFLGLSCLYCLFCC